ncbi:unnamed protein product [Symbiodinium necroappetens]|uniref:PDZ domain-containing protein n=1 Tax=Symbiodinium necroappetens TaxID=1628268 RepID=A0A812W7A9_9DINO|nr:unnamed protein product [Symbiodinium necroappetens]
MKPEHRMKWLAKALQKCQEGKAEKTAIYDIMTHAKFSHDCSSKLGAKMYRLVRAHAVLFSQKQQKFLEGGDYPLHKLYKKAVKKGEVEEDEAGVTAERAEESSRKDASRSRDDARGPDIAALWDRLTALSPGERAARVAALDEATKEKLEEFLEDRGEEDERSPIAPAVEEESGYFSVTLRKLDLSLDTSDEDFLIIKEITPAVSKWNKSLPEHPIQVFDRLIEVNGTRARDALEKAMHSSSEATLRFQRPQQRTVVLKQPGKLGVLANYVPARSLKPWIDTIARGAVDDWNKASPQQAIQEHDRIVCVNGVSEPAEEMLLELARQRKSSLRLTCLHYAGGDAPSFLPVLAALRFVISLCNCIQLALGIHCMKTCNQAPVGAMMRMIRPAAEAGRDPVGAGGDAPLPIYHHAPMGATAIKHASAYATLDMQYQQVAWGVLNSISAGPGLAASRLGWLPKASPKPPQNPRNWLQDTSKGGVAQADIPCDSRAFGRGATCCEAEAFAEGPQGKKDVAAVMEHLEHLGMNGAFDDQGMGVPELTVRSSRGRQKACAWMRVEALNVYLSSSEVAVVMLPACLESQAMLSARLKKLVECQQISQEILSLLQGTVSHLLCAACRGSAEGEGAEGLLVEAEAAISDEWRRLSALMQKVYQELRAHDAAVAGQMRQVGVEACVMDFIEAQRRGIPSPTAPGSQASDCPAKG